MSKNKCIFLDRDGTINVYKKLLSNSEDLKLERKASDAIKLINKSGYLCIVVSNQPVVARNLCTLEEAWQINERLKELLDEKGAYLDDIFICPHHPDRGYPEENKKYKIKCDCRKPAIGMIEEAVKKYNIDLEQSYIIGDTTIDIKTGKSCGIKTVLVKTGLAGGDELYDVKPDYISDNLYDAAKLILEENNIWT
ncbi:D-glycero-alpha-D-manno-heptose-1,7-bisphosphate 7-phosphatase [Crassaminicella profunda]|uniref:D-glycero-alpha-D-manno-heptose-1,7-bisphosphate 7-phosphatase n=1 Tax=Crassaminicella profunda TaxID=1286698 RepID=UPI001CA68372|nr:HAD family hydrolase [Crassaminicella profunda]QZY54311.1 HAD family hydrolase [Crassaminicella profunda]